MEDESNGFSLVYIELDPVLYLSKKEYKEIKDLIKAFKIKYHIIKYLRKRYVVDLRKLVNKETKLFDILPKVPFKEND